MAEPRADPFFIGDHRALDFLNRVAAQWGRQIEWLASGSDLIAWLEHAGAVPADVAAQFREHTGTRALDAAAAQARELREWFRTFVRNHAGKSLPAAALRELGPLNRLLERDEAYRQIETARQVRGGRGGDAPHPLHWEAKRRWGSPKALLLPIADAIGNLVCQEDFALIRKCEGLGCTLWFLDVSKGHARRWCSMAICGNRAKVAAHRARARD
jgi:predicted RNA-binding Zn ribbon-like protein